MRNFLNCREQFIEGGIWTCNDRAMLNVVTKSWANKAVGMSCHTVDVRGPIQGQWMKRLVIFKLSLTWSIMSRPQYPQRAATLHKSSQTHTYFQHQSAEVSVCSGLPALRERLQLQWHLWSKVGILGSNGGCLSTRTPWSYTPQHTYQWSINYLFV